MANEPTEIRARSAGRPDDRTRSGDRPEDRTRSIDRPDESDEQFSRFFGAYADWGHRLAGLLTQNQAAGEEIVQEAMLAVYTRWSSIDHPVTYFRQTLINRANNWHRHRATVDDKLPLLVLSGVDRSTAGDLTDLLARLEFRPRAVLVLRYYGGWSEAEIAEALDCPPGTVKSMASRALAMLRKELEK